MAKQDRKRSGRPAGAAGSAASGSGPTRPAAQGAGGGTARPGAKPIARQSVAAARKSGSNRTQLVIGGIAILVIIGVIVVGVVLNRRATVVPSEGYGPSVSSTATVSNGVVTVANGSPTASIDVFEDALCPICAQFEQQFGQQLNQAIDQGRLAVRYHMLTFLDQRSASADYSTRAAASLLCVAENAGSQPGTYLGYHAALFDPERQPAEDGAEDLSNEQLAALAVERGAPQTAASCITSGEQIAAATAASTSSQDQLRTATGGQVGTPSVLSGGTPVDPRNVDWLNDLLGTPAP